MIQLFVASAIQLSASFAGSWKGSGAATDTDGFKTDCPTLKVSIEQTPAELTIKEIVWDCKDASDSWSEQKYTIQGTQLLNGTAVVGEISADGFKVSTGAIDLPVSFQFTFEPSGALRYHEQWTGKDSVFNVDGELHK